VDIEKAKSETILEMNKWNEKLSLDKDRLDWLEEAANDEGLWGSFISLVFDSLMDVREAIDEAKSDG